MPRIQHSVHVARPPAEVFAITNDIDNWRVLFNEYHESQVISREDAGRFTKLVFRLTNNEGNSWQSWRLLDHHDLIAVAQRQDPLFPFVYMHLTWTYEPQDGGTRMTWTQDFEIDPLFGVPPETVAARMEAHGRENQQRIKGLIESGAVDGLTAQAPA
jgi:aromatase